MTVAPPAPFVELRYNPTDLRERDLPRVGEFLGAPADALQAALTVARNEMVARLKTEMRVMPEPTYWKLLQVADLAWQLVMPKYKNISAPVMADAYIRAYRAVNAGDVPMSVIYSLAERHAEKIGDYFHTSSADALGEGFNSLVNRRLPAKAAIDKVLDAYGLSPRQMRGYVSSTAFEKPVTDPGIRNPKAKARAYIDRAFTSRIKKLSVQEEHNISEQSKQYAWMWLQGKGRLSTKAQKMWITAHDEKVCKVCGPLNGKKVGLNERFVTAEGEFWTPGLHPNCRCVVRLIENQFAKSWDPHQPRGRDGRWAGGTSTHRQLGHKLNAMGSVSSRTAQGSSARQGLYFARRRATELRFWSTPLKELDPRMAATARGAMVWSQSMRGMEQVKRHASGTAGEFRDRLWLPGSTQGIHRLIRAVDSAPANAPALYRGMALDAKGRRQYKVGAEFELPISAWSADSHLGEHYARSNLAEGRHPVLFQLAPKSQALNISNIVSERNAEWLTKGHFKVVGVTRKGDLTTVQVEQVSNRVAKADWDPDEHPRGGDPENRGRFSRLPPRPRPQVAVAERPAFVLPTLEEVEAAEKEELDRLLEERYGDIQQGKIGAPVTGGKIGKPTGKIGTQGRIGVQGKIGVVGQGKVGAAKPEGKVERKVGTIGELSTKGRIELHREVAGLVRSAQGKVPFKLPPPDKDWAVMEIKDSKGQPYPVYAVVTPRPTTEVSPLNFDLESGTIELTHQVEFTPSIKELQLKVEKMHSEQIIDEWDKTRTRWHQTKFFGSGQGDLTIPDDVAYMAVEAAAYRARYGTELHPDHFVTLEWAVRGGEYIEQRVSLDEIAQMIGVNPRHFDVRILQMHYGHDSGHGTTAHAEAETKAGKEKWVTSGVYKMDELDTDPSGGMKVYDIEPVIPS